MKRRLNILCVIVMLVLSYSVIEALYFMGIGAKFGFKAGIEAVEKEKNPSAANNLDYRTLTNMKTVSVIPHAISGKGDELFTDSVYNEKAGHYVPMLHNTITIGMKTNESIVSKTASVLLTFICPIAIVWAIVLFIKIIIAINRSDIFNWRNVRRLRRLGLLLLISFGSSLLSECLVIYNLNQVFSLTNYDLTLSELVSITNLVLGLSTLIMAEVFAIGLKMKEEQELTI